MFVRSRWGPAVNLFEKLAVKEAEVAALLAQAYIGMSKSNPRCDCLPGDHIVTQMKSQKCVDEEVKAVQVLHRALEDMPQSYALLHVQCDFLRSKGGEVSVLSDLFDLSQYKAHSTDSSSVSYVSFAGSKQYSEWALKLARQAVNCAPSEFVTWAKLTEVYIELGRYSDVRAPQFD